MRSFLLPIDEQERIARNKPSPNIQKGYPRVTDGTTSSIIRKTPRRIVQQIPTGRVHSDTEDWLAIVAGFIYTNRIIPNANEQNALIEKCWRVIRTALTHGAAHTGTPFINRGDYFGTDMSVYYIKNLKFEAGKLSDLEANCEFVDAWYQTADIDGIIAKEKDLKSRAKKRGEKYESTWDLEALEEIKEMISAKAEEEKSKTNLTDTTHQSGVKLVHAYQRGVGAEFFTFHPQSEKIVRTKTNKDPRGEMPVQTMYFETDGINPLGTGIVEQVGSLQNLMDTEMQMYQFNRALMLAPPLVKTGTWNKSQAKLIPNTLIDMGSDPTASLKPLAIDSTALNNFPANYGLMKSQLLNLTASPDTSISSEVGNPGFSKTPAGVNAQQATVSVDDNYIRKQFETWFERWSETAINLYFAERTGTEELQLDKDTAMELRQLESQGKLEPGFVSDENKIMIDYDSATPALKFEVDASTSNMKNDAQQLEALDGLLARYEKSLVLQQTIPPKKVTNVWNRIVASSGVENPEELAVSEEELKEQEMQKQAAAMQAASMTPDAAPNGAPPMDQPGMAMPQDVPQAPPQQPQPDLTEEDQAFAIALQDMGYSDDQIHRAFAMEAAGIGHDQIMEMLVAANGASNG